MHRIQVEGAVNKSQMWVARIPVAGDYLLDWDGPHKVIRVELACLWGKTKRDVAAVVTVEREPTRFD